MKKLYKQISIFVVLTLIFNMMTIKVNAADTSTSKTQNTNLTQQGDKKESKIVSEVVDKRDKNIKQFQKEDGSFEAVVYSQPVHYLVNGKWEDIDNTLAATTDDDSNDVLENNKNDFKVKFAKDASSKKLVKLSKDKYEISWGVEGAQKSEPQVKAKDQKAEAATNDKIAQKTIDTKYKDKSAKDKEEIKKTLVANEQKETLDKVKSDVNYANILPNTDINYVLNGDSVKENIILKEKMDNPQFTFDINVKNLKAKLNADNTVVFYDEKDSNKVLYNFEIPFMYDSKGEQCNDIKVQLNETKKGYTLTITPSNSWLNDTARVYPVTIDPPVLTSLGINDIQDTFVCSIDTSDKYNNILTRVGNVQSIGVTRTYLKFTLPQLTPADMVTSATLNIYTDSTLNGGAQVNAHKVLNDWSSYGLSWNSKPGYNSKIEDYNIINASGWNYFNITSIAKDWYNTGNNYGLMLKADNEAGGNVAFRSSDTTVSNARPSVVIYYSSNVGLEKYWDFHSQDVGRAGTGYVNNYNGNLVFQHNDLSKSGNRMPVNITHTYNLKEAVSNIDIGYGIGWRLNLSQTVTTLNAADGLYYVYTDEDGTKHYFKSDSTGTFKDNEGVDLTLTKNSDGSYTIKDKKNNQLNFGTDGYLNNVKDSNNNTLTLNYTTVNNNKRLGSVTDGAGRVTTLQLDGNGRLSAVVDPSGSSVSYGYSGNQLTSITYADSKVSSYGYDSGNKLSTVTNYDGYKMSYIYTSMSPYRINEVAESHTNGTLGGDIAMTYGNNMTSFNDKVRNKKDIYTFNDNGNTISVKDDAGNAKYYKYDDISNVNKLTTESKLQKSVLNLLSNSSLEADNNYSFNNDVNGSVGFSTDSSYIGSRSLKINRTDNAHASYADQVLSLEKGKTYTFSAYVKTNGITNSNNGSKGAFLVAYPKDKNGNYIAVASNHIQGNNDWARLQTTFTVPADSSDNQVIIRSALEFEQGTAYFDALQLEEGSVANRYNLIQNGDLDGSGNMPNSWGDNNCGSNASVIATTDLTHPRSLDSSIFQLNGDANKSLQKISQHINVSGSKGEVFTIGGWGKADSVPRGKFAIEVIVNSSSQQIVTFNFNVDCTEWQYISDKFITADSYSSLDVYLIYEHNVNSSYFDGIQLYKETYGTSYQYDSKGNVISTQDLASQNSKFQYNGNNDLISSTDPKSNSFTYNYDGNHNITQATSAENVVYSFTYDNYGNPKTSKVGDATTYINSSANYTSDGNYMSSLTDSSGNTVNYNYDTTKGTLSSVTDANGKTTNYGYDNMNRLTSASKTADGQNISNSYVYNNDKISQINQNGFSYNFGYDSLGNNTTVSVGNQNLITNNYEARTGKLLDSTYGNGQKMSTLYDGNDNTIGKVYSGDNNLGVSYSGNIQNVGMTSVSGNGALLGTVGQGLRLESLAINLSNVPAGMHIKYQAQVQDIGWQNWVYDGATAGTTGQSKRMEAVCIKLEGAPAGYTVQYQVQVQNIGWMDPVQDGQIAGIVGQALRIEAIKITIVKQRASYKYDANSNLGYKEDYVNGVNYNYSYDLSNRLTRIDESNGNNLAYSYDQNNNMSSMTEKVNGSTYTTGYAFDKDNKPTTVTYNRSTSNTLTNAYDVLGRLTGKTINTGLANYNTSFGYLPGTNGSTTTKIGSITNNGVGISYTYNANGNIETITQNGQVIKYYYNELDEVIREDNQVLNKTITTAYDAGGNIASKTEYPYTTGTPSGATRTYPYTYGDTNWKDKLTNFDGKAISYDAIGNPLTYNGWSFNWELGRQLQSITGNGYTITNKYNDAGIRTSKTVNGVTTNYHLVGDKVTYEDNGTDKIYYTYDSNGNVVSMNLSQADSYTSDLYETAGNHTPVQLTGTNSAAEKFNASKMFDSVSVNCPSWSNNIGNLTFSLYKWNTDYNTTISGAPVTSKQFVNYNDNQWLEINFAPQAAGDYLWVLNNPSETVGVWKYDGSNNSSTAYLNGSIVSGDYMSKISYKTDEYYYVRNAQGDIIGLIDENGAQVVSYTYDTWGKLISTTGSLASTVGAKNPYRYRGYRYDSETGLYYLQSRYYSPDWGRFINADNLGGKIGDLLSHNVFAYCKNNPVNMSDPDGHWSWKATLGVIAAVALVAVVVVCVVQPELIPAVVAAASDAYYSLGAAATVACWRVSAAVSNVVRGTPVQAATLEEEASSSGIKGGAYGKIPKNGGQNHHMPADSVSPFSTYKGPALNMSPEDHRLTASWGNSLEAQTYRAQQADLISQGMFKEAQQMDINDVKGLFGNKYANGIKQMEEYTVKLFED